MRKLSPLGALLALLFVGCAGEGADGAGVREDDLRVAVSREALAFPLATTTDLPHGVAGDRRVVFVTLPNVGRVIALDRVTGRRLGELPQPPDAMILPFALRSTREGHLAVLDPGGFPDPTGALPIARILEYEYRVSRGRLVASHVRTLSLASAPTVFTEDLEALADGSYVVSEAGIGALWIVEADGSVVPAIFPASPAPSDTIEALGPCGFPTDVVVDGIPFRLAGDFAPGVGSLASDDRFLYFGNTCTGGLYRVPLASLRDARPPFARAADIELFSPPPIAGEVDALKGLSVDVYGDPDSLYAMDAFHVRVIRIDLEDGSREVVISSGHLFDFPVASTFLPPIGHAPSPLVVVSDQEHRWTALNVAITEDRFRLPFTVTRVLLSRR